MFEKIENIIVFVSRGILMVLAVIALLVGVISFLYGLSLTLSKTDKQSFVPKANIEVFDQKYLNLKKDDLEDSNVEITNESILSEEIEIAKKIQRNLAKNFKNQTDISRYITVKNSYEFWLDIIAYKDTIGNNLPNEIFLELLLKLSADSKNSYVLDRVNRYDDVDKILNQLLIHLITEIDSQYELLKNERDRDRLRVENNKNLGLNLIIYSSIGIAIFIVIILYIILFKIEINIRKISEEIKK